MRRRAITALALLLAALGLVVAGCGGAAEPAGGEVPESASLAPADALAFVTVTTDDSSGQWTKAANLLERLPGANQDLQKEIASALDEQGLTWKGDVEPALGPEVVLVVTADQKTIVLTQPEDESKLTALIAKSDEPVVRATVDGWTALAEQQSDLTAYETSLARGTLAGNDALEEGFAALPTESLVRAWVDVAALTPQLGQELGQASTDLDLGVDWLSAAFAAEDDGLRLAVGLRTPGGDGTEYEPKLVERVPADAVAALSFGGTQKVVDQLERRLPLDQIADQVEQATGVSVDGLLDAFSGEGIVYVRPAGTAPEVTIALTPPDPEKVWQTVDRVAHRIAADSGTKVLTTTEEGRDVSIVAVQGATVRYARVDDDTVILTTGVTGIRDFVSDGDKLDSSDAFRRATDAVGLADRTSGFLYVDVDGLLPVVQGIAGGALSADDRAELEKLDAFVLEASRGGETTTLTGFLRLND
ncbi:MAG TPA: DUF3352 domain-containing protein [Gaiella sp.]|nr:DUF3352 domain-containing protein [Gaiella sp.]